MARKKSKEEIYAQIVEWARKGLLKQKSDFSNSGYGQIWKMVQNRELFLTTNSRIVATDEAVRDKFQELMKEGRVMSIQDVTIKHRECNSEYAVKKLVADGVLLKIDRFSTAALYIE